MASSGRQSGRRGAKSALQPRSVVPTTVAVLSAACHARLDLIGQVDESTAVTGVTLRAQSVRPGDLFAALPGANVHGAEFAADALARGATAVLTDPRGRDIIESLPGDHDCVVLVHSRPRTVLGALSSRIYGQPSRRLKLIGITGTSGKTTTSYLAESALMAAGRTVGLIGTVETRIAGARQPSSLTTPEAPDLQAMLATMHERHVDTVVMEVSSHALSLGRVDGSVFAVGAFTNLSQDHLDFHRTMADYFDAKAILFQPDSPVHALRSVVCVDDDAGKRMARIAGRGVVTVSVTGVPGVAWSAGESAVTADGGQDVEITDPHGAAHQMHVPLPGRYNVANALTAIAIATTAGVPLADAIRGIREVRVPGRMERIDRGQKFLAIVDYAHKPAALAAVIDTLRGQGAKRLAVVVGAGGDRDRGKREIMGEVAARGAELVIVTDDNPRTEDPASIRKQLIAGAASARGEPSPLRSTKTSRVKEIGDRAEAIAEAVRWARSGDVVLVAGKGHEVGQEINGVKHPFDDRDVLAAAIDDVLKGGK